MVIRSAGRGGNDHTHLDRSAVPQRSYQQLERNASDETQVKHSISASLSRLITREAKWHYVTI